MMKAHGFMKAMNSITDSLYTEITAGFVTFIFEDSSGRHSDSILDIIPILNAIPIYSIRSDNNTIYQDVVKAYEESEKLKQPVVVLIDSLSVTTETIYERNENLKKSFSYKRDIFQHVVHPLLSDFQYKVFLAKKLGGDLTVISKTNLPKFPDELPERARNTAIKYTPLFDVFKNYRGDIVTGDTSGSSSFCLPPYNCIDIVTYMGGSIPLAIGAFLSGYKNVWAITGDFGFIAAGYLGLIELLNREIPLKILVFYNKQAAATGGQPINKKILRHILAGFEKNILHISNPNDPFEIDAILKEASASTEMKIIIADYPN